MRGTAAGAAALALPGAAGTATTAAAEADPPHRWIGAGPFTHVHDPSLPGRRRYLNDHTLIKAYGRWHLFGIVGDSAPPGASPDSAAEVAFAHASAPGPYGPWTPHADALTVDRSYFGEEHLWAPHVVEAGGTFWMFYAAGGRGGAAINLATSSDLFTWTRVPSGPLFRGIAVAAMAPSGLAAFQRRQTVPSGGWDDWQHLFGWTAAAPTLAPGADGRLEAFALSPGGARLDHRWYLDTGGAWAAGEGFGEPGVPLAAPPTAAADVTGRLHLFAVTADGRIRTRVQERPSGAWRPWSAFGERLVAPLRAGSPAG
ncbi:hypothetical protein GCM10010425_20980 [Streptomyces spororaveus]